MYCLLAAKPPKKICSKWCLKILRKTFLFPLFSDLHKVPRQLRWRVRRTREGLQQGLHLLPEEEDGLPAGPRGGPPAGHLCPVLPAWNPPDRLHLPPLGPSAEIIQGIGILWELGERAEHQVSYREGHYVNESFFFERERDFQATGSLNRMTRYSYFSSYSMLQVRLTKTFVTVVVIIHFFASLWYFIACPPWEHGECLQGSWASALSEF